jgi:hypothetical protein
LYPILDYPGWDHDRACQTGLWGPWDATGSRLIHDPLARELVVQSALIEEVRRPLLFPDSTACFTDAADENAGLAYGDENKTSR